MPTPEPNGLQDTTSDNGGESTIKETTIKETTLAEAYEDEVITIEGSTYFPPSAVESGLLADSDTLYICPWKGRARYYDVIIDGIRHHDAAWAYPSPKKTALLRVGRDFSSYVAFDPAQVSVGADAPAGTVADHDHGAGDHGAGDHRAGEHGAEEQ